MRSWIGHGVLCVIIIVTKPATGSSQNSFKLLRWFSLPFQIQVLSTSTPNDGGFSPTVDFSGLEISEDYQIRIEDSNDPTVFGLSEVFGVAEEAPVFAPPPFSFLLTDPIKVTSPGFQEVFPQAPDTTVSTNLQAPFFFFLPLLLLLLLLPLVV